MFIILNPKHLSIILLACVCILSISAIVLGGLFSATAEVNALPTHGYKVYLTFDDGPSKNTEKTLDTLKKHEVNGTFFVIGQTGDYEVSLYRRIVDEGHSLGLHSYTHKIKKIYASAVDYIADFERLRDWIYESVGISPKFCRMVGGSHADTCSKKARSQIVEYFCSNGYTCYDWDIDPRDSCSYTLAADAIADNIISAAKKKPNQDLVILMHDDVLRKTLPGALDIIIPYFKERGYAFGVLDADTELNGSRAVVR